MRPRRPTRRLDPPAPEICQQAPALHFAAGEWRNGRRAGLRSRCRESGVEVRPLSRLPNAVWASRMQTVFRAMRRRDVWIVVALIALAVGLPAVVGVVSGAIS